MTDKNDSPTPLLKLEQMSTEESNPFTVNIDRVGTVDAVNMFFQEESAGLRALQAVLPQIATAVDLIVEAFNRGGRLVYMGAGTSGRLAFLDAAECPPTFGVPSEMVVPLMAGGEGALKKAVEGAEDDREAAVRDLEGVHFQYPDMLIGITASGTTPYVRAGIEYATKKGCKSALVACNKLDAVPGLDVLINPLVGPEVITGSTRLKSGTVCKMILNMLSSVSMIKLGKVYRNLMVDVQATNKKLRIRARRLVMIGGNVEDKKADELLEKTAGKVKPAIFMAITGESFETAQQALSRSGDNLARALGEF